MRILLINYRYHDAGGPERYLFNVKNLLESHGHEIVPFSLRYSENAPDPYDRYFALPPGRSDRFYYDDVKTQPTTLLALAARQFWSPHVYRSLIELIRDCKPDIAYVFHFLKRLSPAVLDACHAARVPLIVRVSDFGLLCPKNIFFRDGAICEECRQSLFACIRHRCIKGSLFASCLSSMSLKFSYARSFQTKINEIVCPSNFTARFFRNDRRFYGIRVNHLPTLVTSDEQLIPTSIQQKTKSTDLVYWGRVSEDKGLDVLLNAAIILHREDVHCQIRIYGCSDDKYGDHIRYRVRQEQIENVRIYGFLPKKELIVAVRTARASLVPSVWYDNMPNSLIESQSLGIPVIASRIGSLRETITEGKNGFLFSAGNAADLARTMKEVISMSNRDLHEMSQCSIRWAAETCSPEVHYQGLMEIFLRNVCTS